jgi:hypothetical protein
MSESELRLVKRLAEFRPKDKITDLPHDLRGIYVLYKLLPTSRRAKKFNVVYVGMAARGGIRGRLQSHRRSKRKGKLWSHFSVFEVWDNIRNDEIVELEGLFRSIYRKDPAASALNLQRGFKKAKRVRQNDLSRWHKP